MAFRVIEVQSTPNPNAVKLILDKPIAEAPLSFLDPAAAEGNPLARSLFAIAGVSGLLFLNDFITINKTSEAKWADITRRVRQTLARG